MNRVLLCLVMLAAIGCGGPRPSPDAAQPAPEPQGRAAPPAAPVQDGRPRIVALGDSLTAGLGLPRDEAYPAQLERKLAAAGYAFEVVNAGVSGDTSSDGLRRAGWALEGQVRLLIVALGANDGLRGLPVSQMEENLRQIVLRARQRGIPVLLAGMEAPPNYGEPYAAAFRQVFQTVAKEYKLPLVPFLLEGVAGVPELNQTDGIHPTAAGAARMADHLLPAVIAMIAK